MKTFSDPLKQSGITFFEIVVVVLLAGLLMSFAIERIVQLQIVAEKVAVEQNLVQFKSAVSLEFAERIVKKGRSSVSDLENTNPISYLSELPYNYIGEKFDNDAEILPLESWYFDTRQNILVYKVKNIKNFDSSLDGIPRIRFKIKLLTDDNNNKQDKLIRGVTVKSLEKYQWNLN